MVSDTRGAQFLPVKRLLNELYMKHIMGEGVEDEEDGHGGLGEGQHGGLGDGGHGQGDRREGEGEEVEVEEDG